MLSWIRRLAATRKKSPFRKPNPGYRNGVCRIFDLEALEDRTAPATVVWGGAAVDDQVDLDLDGLISNPNTAGNADTAGTNRWSWPGNWQGGVVPQDGDDVVFPAGTPKQTTFIPQSNFDFFPMRPPVDNFNSFNDLTGLTLNSIRVEDNSYAIGGNRITLLNFVRATYAGGSSGFANNFNITRPAQLLTVDNAGATLVFLGDLDETTAGSGLLKNGPGTVSIGGFNTFTGLVEVDAGTLNVTNGQALGTAAVGTTVLNGATLAVTDASVANESLTVTGTGVGGVGALLGIGTSRWSGGITLSTSATIGVNANGELTSAGGISGAGDLTKVGAGTLVLPVNNSYGGRTLINNGVVSARASGALAPGSDTLVANGATLAVQGIFTIDEVLHLNGAGVLDAGGNGTGALRSDVSATDVTWIGNVIFDSSSTWGGDLKSQVTITGSLSADLAMTLTKIGASLFLLPNANESFFASTVINNGIIALRDPLGLGPSTADSGGAITVDQSAAFPGGTLQLEGVFAIDKDLSLGALGDGSQGALKVVPTGYSDRVIEVEPNNTLATAQNVDDALWNLFQSTDIANSTTIPHITIAANGNRTFDYFSFTGTAGSTVTFDIDGQNFDTEIFLYDSLGNLLDQNDNDNSGDAGDGTSNVRDSRLSFTFAATGTYIIGVGENPSAGSPGGITGDPPDDHIASTALDNLYDAYLLHISLQNHPLATVADSDVAWDGTIVLLRTTAITVATGSQLDVSNEIFGPQAATLEKFGGGTLTLSNANTYLGATTVREGLLIITDPEALGPAGSEPTTISGGATIQIGGGLTVNNEVLTLFGAGLNGMGALDSNSGINTWAGPVNYQGVDPVFVAVDAGQLTFSNVVSGAASFHKTGAGTLIYTGSDANTLTGTTNVDSGTLILNKTAGIQALGGNVVVGDSVGGDDNDVLIHAASDQIKDTATVRVNSSGLYNLADFNESIASLTLEGGSVTTGTGLLTLGGNVTTLAASGEAPIVTGLLSLGNATRTFTIADDPLLVDDLVVDAAISGGAGAGITKSGPGSMTLSNVNSYTGPTSVTAGTLKVGVIGAIPPVTNLTISGGLFDLNNNNTSVASLAGAAAGTLALGASALTNGSGNTSTTFAGVITGAAGSSLIKTGTGTLTLAGNSPAYLGTTQINGGTVLVNANQGGAAVAIASGATLGGNGTTGAVTSTGGNVSPGTSGIATLNTNGNTVLDSDSTFVVEIGATSGTSDRLNITGSAALNNATLNVTIPGVAPPAGSTFTILQTTTGVSGVFNMAGVPLPDGGTFTVGIRTFSIDYTPTAVILTVQSGSVTTVAGVPNASTFAQNVVITATVAPLGGVGPAPLGTVTFFDVTTSTTLATGISLTPGVGSSTASITVSSLIAGSHVIRADYSGSGTYFTSNGSYTQTVNRAPSSVTAFTSSKNGPLPNFPVFGEQITFFVTITAGSPPEGTVRLVDLSHGNTIIASKNIVAGDSGSISMQVANVPVGTSVIQAQFDGGANFLASTSGAGFAANINQTVTQGATSTSLTSADSTTVFGEPVTFTAIVLPVAPSTATPTGTVTFFDSTTSTTLSTVPLVSGSAQLIVNNLSLGGHAIQATFNDSSGNYSTSFGILTQTISAATTVTTVQSSTPGNASVFGQPVTFTATVNPAPGTIAPTGTVTFVVDSVAQSPVSVNGSGQASFTVSNLSHGSHTIEAQYTSNSANFISSISGTLLQTVGAATGQIVVTPSRSTVPPGGLVTFTATVTAPPSNAVPTGTVTFHVDGNPVATTALSGAGQASFSTSTLTLGMHTITATYNSNSPALFIGGAVDSTTMRVRKDLYAVGADAGSTASVNVYDAGTGALLFDFDAYPGFAGGVRVAVGDVNGDGVSDIITGSGPGAAGHVKAFDGATGGLLRSFFAFGNFNGGVTVAAGDLDGDGRDDIFAGASVNSHVKVFSGASQLELRSFFAYEGFTGAVRVAAGDVDGDGYADIITAAVSPGGHIKTFSGTDNTLIRSFFAYVGFQGSVNVAAGDIDGDGKADIISGADSIAPHVKVFNGLTLGELQSFYAYSYQGSGVRVGSVDRDGDGRDDLITGTPPGYSPHVQVLNGLSLAAIDSFFAFDPAFQGGVYVGGS